MSVFTTVTEQDLKPFLARYALGSLTELRGISAGVTNTNYFVTTTHGRYVLTLFETLRADELPFYVNLMVHLGRHGIAVAAPIANSDDAYIDELNGKPTLLVPCLPGMVTEHPTEQQCWEVGEMLALMHKAAASYHGEMANPRPYAWWESTAAQVYRFMPPDAAQLLQNELALQAAQPFDQLPQGVVHADLFRDNVLMNGERVGGFIDFYYACNDALLYDLAIALNDWCVETGGDMDEARSRAMLAGYQSVRVLNDAEKTAWPLMLRGAAIRFWTSRLYDFHLPAEGEMTFAKDPGHFEQVLRRHIQRTDFWL